MIRYALQCANKHGFEAWFASSAGYEDQAANGQITCPACGTLDVGKAVMTPNIAPGGKQRDEPPPTPAEAVAMLRAVRRHVLENADYVGPRFAEEARKIHFEEVEPRGIYGEATATEVKELSADGVEVCPLPQLPEDSN